MEQVVAVYRTQITGKKPVRQRVRRQHWRDIRVRTEKRFALMDKLGIAGPQPAHDAWARFLTLREEITSTHTQESGRDELARELAAGNLTAKQAAARLAKASDPAELEKAAKDERELLETALDEAMRAVWVAWDDEDDWLDELLKVHAEILDDPDARYADRRWVDLHELAAAVLAQPPGARSLASNPLAEQRFEHPDRPYFWQLDRAKSTDVDATRKMGGGVSHVEYVARHGAPRVSLERVVAHRGEWKPTILTAERAIETCKAIVRREEGKA